MLCEQMRRGLAERKIDVSRLPRLGIARKQQKKITQVCLGAYQPYYKTNRKYAFFSFLLRFI
jgi:hypothetical protein